jgi:phosphotransferase system HPr-like phosphotransfer protein
LNIFLSCIIPVPEASGKESKVSGEGQEGYSATLHEIRSVGEVPEGGVAFEDRLVPIKEVGGTLDEVFLAAEDAGSEALSIESFLPGDGWRFGERVTLVRSPATRNWYEHAFLWDEHPFVEWAWGMKDSLREEIETNEDPLNPRGCSGRREDVVHTAIYYDAPGVSHAYEVFRPFMREDRDHIRILVEDGRLRKLAGEESSLSEIRERAEKLGATVVRAEAPVGYEGERVKVFGRVSNASGGWYEPYLLSQGMYLPEFMERGGEQYLFKKSRAEYPITIGSSFGGSEWINNSRTAALLRKVAFQFHSRITVRRPGEEAGIKNMLSFLKFNEGRLLVGDEVTVIAEGADAEEAASFMAGVMSGELKMEMSDTKGGRLREITKNHIERMAKAERNIE